MDIKRIDLESFIHGSSRMVRLLERTRLRAMLTALILVFVVTNGQAQSAQTEAVQEEVMTTINLQIGSKTFTAKALDNASSRALLAMLPMTVTMSELNNNEKYYQLPNGLPTNAQDVGTINMGDLMLYGSDTLVLFYKSFTTSYSYTRLGYLENVSGLEDALGSGNVEVKIELAE
jgi:hypothetical protein